MWFTVNCSCFHRLKDAVRWDYDQKRPRRRRHSPNRPNRVRYKCGYKCSDFKRSKHLAKRHSILRTAIQLESSNQTNRLSNSNPPLTLNSLFSSTSHRPRASWSTPCIPYLDELILLYMNYVVFFYIIFLVVIYLFFRISFGINCNVCSFATNKRFFSSCYYCFAFTDGVYGAPWCLDVIRWPFEFRPHRGIRACGSRPRLVWTRCTSTMYRTRWFLSKKKAECRNFPINRCIVIMVLIIVVHNGARWQRLRLGAALHNFSENQYDYHQILWNCW